MSSTGDAAGFNANYQVLKKTADWLAKQDEPDIDQLVPRVEEAMKAYRACKDRLDQVRSTLEKYLTDGDQAPQSPDGRAPVATPGMRADRDGKPDGEVPEDFAF